MGKRLPICAICGEAIKEELAGQEVIYTGPDDIQVSLPCDMAISALLRKDGKDIWICEQCYPDGVSKHFSGDDLAEIHYGFGLDYQDKKRLDLAKVCFLRAIAVRRKANYFAALGTVAQRREIQIQYYREALALDPECLIARLNLPELESRELKEK